MNAPATLSLPASSAATQTKPRRRGWLFLIRFLLVLVLVTVALLAVPPSYRFIVRQLISFEMYRLGGSFSVQKVGGSLWEPVTLTKAYWHLPFRGGSVLQLETDRVEAEFSWRELFSENGGRWFRRFSVDGVNGKVELPANPENATAHGTGWTKPEWLSAPARVEAKDVDLTITANGDFVRLQDGSLLISEMEPGAIHFGQVVVKQPWLDHTFRNVRGTTAVQGSRVVVADLNLEPGVSVPSFSAEMADLISGRLNAEIQIAAFGGTIRAQAQTLPLEQQPGIEASGSFSQIGIAPLATFLGVSDAAGGTIKTGNFTFRGSPRNLPKAAVTIRLDAVNFQWESRQWDSLVLGATLLERRVQIPELELHQGHNHLSLSGEMALPSARTEWWKSDFNFNIAAKIENLTELSALLLPEFKYAAGKVNIDGAVRGKDQQFNGALIVSGSSITWRNAPIEEMHAALKITGNELQVANFELLNDDDFVRGRGVVNILGAKQYWGEFRASVVDLASYAALLQPPIVPEPLAGGAVINWWGEGSAKGHSGKFLARLHKLRTVGATGAFLHPLQADLEGAYAPGNVQFSRFSLSDEQSAFTANVTVGNKALTLQQIRLTHGDELWLEGDATLPLDLWRAWPNTALATLLTENVPSKVNLTAHKLQLMDASRLTGWKWPIEGVLDGTVTAEGIVGALNTSGNVTLQNARVPLGWSGDALTNVSAELALTGQTLNINQFNFQHASGSYSAKGQIDFTNLRDTTLRLALKSEASTLTVFQGEAQPAMRAEGDRAFADSIADHVDAISRIELQIEGLASAASVSGKAQIQKVNLGGSVDTTPVWKSGVQPALPSLFQISGSPWRAWKFNIDATAENVPVEPSGGTLAASLRLTGAGAAPVLTGEVSVEQVRALAGNGPIQIEHATLVFRENNPSIPSFELHATGQLLENAFVAAASGPLSHPVREFSAPPPLTDTLVQERLAGEQKAPRSLYDDSTTFSFAAPAELTGGAPAYDWAPIIIEQAPAPEQLTEQIPSTPTPAPAESAPPAAAANPLP